jgi:hypothetical protein
MKVLVIMCCKIYNISMKVSLWLLFNNHCSIQAAVNCRQQDSEGYRTLGDAGHYKLQDTTGCSTLQAAGHWRLQDTMGCRTLQAAGHYRQQDTEGYRTLKAAGHWRLQDTTGCRRLCGRLIVTSKGLRLNERQLSSFRMNRGKLIISGSTCCIAGSICKEMWTKTPFIFRMALKSHSWTSI